MLYVTEGTFAMDKIIINVERLSQIEIGVEISKLKQLDFAVYILR